MKMVSRVLASISMLAAYIGTASAQDMPGTPVEFYRAGERFAHCSAYFAFVGKIAREQGLENNAIAFDGMERGWRLAGLLLLTEGLEKSRQPQAQQLFSDMQAVKIDQLRALREMQPVTYFQEAIADYEKGCSQWLDLQKSIIAALRGAGSD